MTSRRVDDALKRHRLEERQRAFRALLMRPLLLSSHEDFPAVRRHADELRAWLQRETGWTLLIEREGARLFKRPGRLDDGTRGGPGFDRRRYVVLCLTCAVLERSEWQITLRNLGEELLTLAAAPDLEAAGFRFALDQAHQRRDLVHVCRFLIDLGVLSRVAGDEEGFVAQTSDALYDVHRRILAQLLACTRGPSTYPSEQEPKGEARLRALVGEYVPDSQEGQRTATRHALARRLLDDPVVYFDELDPDSQEYFSNQRGTLATRLAAATGLVPEQRAEGTALIDPDGELSDARLPAEGTLAHATLLVAEHLATALRGEPERFIAEAEIAVFLRRAADTYGRYWRKAEREPGAEVHLARAALDELHKLGLVCFSDGGVRARPALARYAVAEPELRQAQLTLA